MQTDRLTVLAREPYDLLVIGGGVTGAFCARDAALRGLKVCLLEAADFGGATSANSLKTIHGGFRYLGSGDLARTRESIFERSTWLRIAPHLVRPLPCLIATHGWGLRSRWALGLGLAAYNFLGRGRNRGLAPERHIPASQLVSKDDCAKLFSGFDQPEVTGGALWYDAQAMNSERLVVEVILAAQEAGATAVNYAMVTGLGHKHGRVEVEVRDALTGQEQLFIAEVVLNAAGPWAVGLSRPDQEPPKQALGMNLVVRRRLAEVAVGVESHGQGASDPLFGDERYLFIAPWGDYSLLGTSYTLHDPAQGPPRITAEHIAALLTEFQTACPQLALTPADVSFFHYGLLPLDQAEQPRGLAEKYAVLDHQHGGGPPGVITLSGVKYTTGRALAARAVDLAMTKLGRQPVPCRTSETPLPGAAPGQLTSQPPKGLTPASWNRLTQIYGSRATQVAGICDLWPMGAETLTPETEVINAEVLFAVHHEMAHKLCDVVLRRTGMGSAARPPLRVLETAAAIMGIELGWDEARFNQEVAEAQAVYAPLGREEEGGHE